MYKTFMKSNLLIKIFYYSLIKLPSPVNISVWWNFGSMLGVCLMIQIISGFILSMHYCANVDYSFNSIIHIMQDVNFGWLIRFIHMNGASCFFVCMYLHIGRGIYYSSFKLVGVWFIGTLMFLFSMAAAFMGYVLPWGQMSYWGATVITNLISAIPYLGDMIVFWLWGGFSINNATLNRFYSVHFILPLLIMFLVLIHLMFLHFSGSSNPIGVNSDYYKVSFYPYFVYKDLLGFMLIFIVLFYFVMFSPYYLSDPDNFIQANSMITPAHIQPEWYFLFAYAILRSIPSKLGGVIALFMSILILLVLSLFIWEMNSSLMFFPFNQLYFWMWVSSFLSLTWGGAQVIEFPFVLISQINSFFYFSYFLLSNYIHLIWYNLIWK